jgi:hypothetical protein
MLGCRFSEENRISVIGRYLVKWSLKDCWVIYRNPEGTPEKNDEYLGAPGYGIYPFSQIE